MKLWESLIWCNQRSFGNYSRSLLFSSVASMYFLCFLSPRSDSWSKSPLSRLKGFQALATLKVVSIHRSDCPCGPVQVTLL